MRRTQEQMARDAGCRDFGEFMVKFAILWNHGVTVDDICEELDISEWLVHKLRMGLGLKPRTKAWSLGKGRYQRRPAPESPRVRPTRPCLKCRKRFESKGNFICDNCHVINANINPMMEGVSL